MNNDGKIRDLKRLETHLAERYLETSNAAYFWAKAGVNMVIDILLGYGIPKALADLELEIGGKER